MRNDSLNAAKTYAAEADVGGEINGWFGRAAEYLACPFLWLVATVAGWGITLKIRIWLVVFCILPCLVALVLCETHPEDLQVALAVFLMLAIIAFIPMANAVAYILIGRDLKEIAAFCARLKEGDYGRSFDLPVETEEENQVIELKRNLNWMAHVISHRESWLQAALEGAHQDKNHFETLSNLDPLTGLANRRHFEYRLAELMRETDLTGRPLSVIFLDCDNFKTVNDCFGHQAGDLLLKRLGEILRGNVRRHLDLPFRYGGDEFGVVCVGLTPEQTVKPAERIRAQFVEHGMGEATLSIGIAGYDGSQQKQADSQGELMEEADNAAYQAKAMGGNRVVVALGDGRWQACNH